MSKTRIKVTDRRMFTADGELRDTFKDIAEKPAKEPAQEEAAAPAAEATAAEATAAEATAAEPASPEAAEPEEPLESGATFQDLVGLLAQSASVYLSQASQQIENRGELMQMARMHVDLLTIVQRKSRGNLDAAEQALVDQALYQLRMAFVQHG